ncbi:MAG: sigma-70 family RNA polymerase sigma factor [Deltaproteobacteria bacterium]|nr:sigma-70 family RNA polymerase sigma factor [Deltaproteobacteria bacterium]
MKSVTKYKKSNISSIPFTGDDWELVEGVRNGNIGACTAFYDRYSIHVQKVLTRIMGPDQEIMDLCNEVFFQSLKSIDKLKDPYCLKAWITQIAVFTGRRCIRKRKRTNWLKFVPFYELPEMDRLYGASEIPDKSVRDVRDVISKLSPDDQIVFTLRYMEQMEIAQIADACGYSLRTAKRRLASCEVRFKKIAKDYPLIANRLQSSEKWRNR